jgi:hypothetical protein
MAVPNQAITPVRQLQLPHPGQEGLGLQLDRLREKPSCAGPQHIRQGILDRVGLTQADNVGRRVHGVSLSSRGSGRLDTRLDTPPQSAVVTQFPPKLARPITLSRATSRHGSSCIPGRSFEVV